MGWATGNIAKLKVGEAVSFRPLGGSMSSKIESGQLSTVASVDPADVSVGDIVLCKVHGTEYLHLVKVIQGSRFQIGNKVERRLARCIPNGPLVGGLAFALLASCGGTRTGETHMSASDVPLARIVMDSSFSPRCARRATSAIHTKKGSNCARLLARGQSNKEIASTEGKLLVVKPETRWDARAPKDAPARGKTSTVETAGFGRRRLEPMATFDRITFDPNILGGRACIRGMPIPVSLIVAAVAHGASVHEVLADHPDLVEADVTQALEYAAWLTTEEGHSAE